MRGVLAVLATARRRRLTRETVESALFRAVYLAILVAVLLPLVVVVGTSFNEAGVIAFPPTDVSLVWYRRFLESPAWMRALWNSVAIALGTAALATPVGVMAAYGVGRRRSRWFSALAPVALLPLLVPPVVTAVALVIYLDRLGLYYTYPGIVLAHSLWATPLVFFVMRAVFARFDWNRRDAALDLGATPTRAFREVVLPQTKAGVMAGALIAFVVSLQEFVMALFLTGYETRTVPVLAWNALRGFVDPMVSVVSTLLIALAILPLVPIVAVYGWDWLAARLG